jgi:transcriptional regulator of acetoin/glycerol metabolism
VVDVQLLAATHTDLAQAVSAGRFRQDLLYRLNVVEVKLPALRQRTDLQAAVQFVLAELDPTARLSPGAMQRLCSHDWPGNFRELRSVITRALIQAHPACDGIRLEEQDIAAALPGRMEALRAPEALPASGLQRAATQTVVQAFDRCGRSVSRTSRSLGISRTTVYRHLREAGRVPARP